MRNHPVSLGTRGRPGSTAAAPVRAPAVLAAPEALCCPPLARAPLDDSEAADLSRVFKALADPVRLRLLSLIASHAGGEVCVCDLSSAFTVTAPTISHHLKVLREAGLITGERRGTWIYYRAVPALLGRLGEVFARHGQTPG